MSNQVGQRKARADGTHGQLGQIGVAGQQSPPAPALGLRPRRPGRHGGPNARWSLISQVYPVCIRSAAHPGPDMHTFNVPFPQVAALVCSGKILCCHPPRGFRRECRCPWRLDDLRAVAYDLRHAAVSLWLNAGVPATEVARRAGHGVAVLLKVYANCIDGQADAANQCIGTALDEHDSE